MVRTTRPSDSDTVYWGILYTEELFLSTLSMYNSPNISDGHHVGGGVYWQSTQYNLADPAGFHTSPSDLPAGYRFMIRLEFLYNNFVTGEDDKALFSLPGDKLQYLA